MRERSILIFRPGLERLEAKLTLSAGASALAASARAAAIHKSVAPQQQLLPNTGITMERITNPQNGNQILTPPFDQVLVQSVQPVPGQTYNIVFISLWNGTGQTFNASNGLTVKMSNQTSAHAYPILTGDQQWVPRQRIVFYILTKQYFPLSPSRSAGFAFNFVNPRVQATPGPSGLFLRVKYNPATFASVLNKIVAHGPGSYGHSLGIADTSIWEIIPQSSKVIRL
jgi:hypothetical protein